MYNMSLLWYSTKLAGVIKVIKDTGIVWAGLPQKTVVDKGAEFGAEFLSYTSDNGIYQKVIPVDAPWQHGLVERHEQV